jgi:CRISPR/Cas system CMR-associated protein Cmr5 small subunit
MGEYKIETQAVLNRIQNDIDEYTDLIEKMKEYKCQMEQKIIDYRQYVDDLQKLKSDVMKISEM